MPNKSNPPPQPVVNDSPKDKTIPADTQRWLDKHGNEYSGQQVEHLDIDTMGSQVLGWYVKDSSPLIPVTKIPESDLLRAARKMVAYIDCNWPRQRSSRLPVQELREAIDKAMGAPPLQSSPSTEPQVGHSAPKAKLLVNTEKEEE